MKTGSLVETDNLGLTHIQRINQCLLVSRAHIPPGLNLFYRAIAALAVTGCFIDTADTDTGGLHFFLNNVRHTLNQI